MTSLSISRPKVASQSTWQKQRSRTGFLFVLPTVIFVAVFFIIPLLMTSFMSLHDWPLFGPRTFIGFQNYTHLFEDRQLLKSLGFTERCTLIIKPPRFIVA